MKVLVTGHQGKIGKHVVPALVEAGHDVRGFDKQSGADLNDLVSVMTAISLYEPGAIVHLAGVKNAFFEGMGDTGWPIVIACSAGTGYPESSVALGLSTVYGPGMGGVVQAMIEQEAQSRPDNQNPRGVDIVNGGTKTLDFIHISDVTRAFVEALGWEPGYYEVATGTEHSVWDAFRLLTYEWGFTPKKNEVHAAVQDPIPYAHTTRCDLPWTPLTLEEGLKLTIAKR